MLIRRKKATFVAALTAGSAACGLLMGIVDHPLANFLLMFSLMYAAMKLEDHIKVFRGSDGFSDYWVRHILYAPVLLVVVVYLGFAPTVGRLEISALLLGLITAPFARLFMLIKDE